jgi:hypothetical protein
MVDIIKIAFDICLHYMTYSLLLYGSPQLVHTFMRTAVRSISITAVLERFLIDRLQNPLHRQFHHLVFKAAYS